MSDFWQWLDNGCKPVAPAKPAHIASRLIGPAGWRTASGETVSRSYFQRDDGRQVWQWFALDPAGGVICVSEMPFSCRGVCDTAYGALWALRDIVAYLMPRDTRCYRDL